jgi:hypothetical protein
VAHLGAVQGTGISAREVGPSRCAAPRVRLAMTHYTGYQGLNSAMIARAIAIIERALGATGSLRYGRFLGTDVTAAIPLSAS